MATIIIEYSSLAGGAGPREGKFVQLEWRGREYLLFAPKTLHDYHNQILGQFLAEQGIAHHWASQQTLAVDDPDLNILGGGRFRADPRAASLSLWDNSQAYGRFREAGLAERIAAAAHPWSGYTVVIR